MRAHPHRDFPTAHRNDSARALTGGCGDRTFGAVDSIELEKRSRRWLITSDPALLWPGVDAGALAPAALGIEECTRRILGGRAATLGRADGDDARVIGIAALISGMGPLLGYWLEHGQLDVAEPLARVLKRHLAHGRARIGRIRREVTPILEALVAAGTEPGILKGYYTTHVYFPEPGLRPLADVDVYVAPARLARATHTLTEAGFIPANSAARFKEDWYPPDGPGRIRSFELWDARSPWKLELHSALDFGPVLRHGVHLDATNPVPSVWDALGVPLRVTEQPMLFVAGAVHMSSELANARLLRLVELVFMARRDVPSGALEWNAVEELLERTGATRFAHPALALVEQLAPGTVPSGLCERARQRSSHIARGVVRSMTPATPIIATHVSFAERVMWESGSLGVIRRVLEMFLPPRRVPMREMPRIYAGRIWRICVGRIGWGVASRA